MTTYSAGLDDPSPDNSILLEMAVEEKMKAIEHWEEVGRIIEHVVALYGVDLQ